MRAVALIAAILCAAGSSAADEPTLAQAEQLLTALDYGKAVQTAQAVVRRGGLPSEALRRSYALLGRALAGLGKTEEAKTFFMKLLALDPSFTLESGISPKIRKPLVDAQADWAGRPGITLVHRQPTTARVDRELVLSATVIEDPLKMVKAGRVTYTLPGSTESSSVKVAGKGELVFALPLPALKAKPGTLTYRLDLLDEHDNALVEKGSLNVSVGAAGQVVDGDGDAQAVVAKPTGNPWYTRWWIWTIAGVVVAGAATTAVVLTTRPTESDIVMGWEVRQ